MTAVLAVLLESYSADRTQDGHARLVRHGHLPEREVITGIGAVPVKVPRVRDRGNESEKVRFTSTILPPYLRKAKSIEELLPWLYLKWISTGDFHDGLVTLTFRPLNSFTQPFVLRPRGFCHLTTNAAVVDYRTH